LNNPSDRRDKTRFALRRDMHYTLLDEGRVIGAGSGRTVDMSSRGAAFTTSERLQPGTAIEISVSWPALLDGHSLLRLVAFGFVVRSTSNTAACSISKFEFRTQARGGTSLQELGLKTAWRGHKLPASA